MATATLPAASITSMTADYVQKTASASLQIGNGGSVSIYLPNVDPTISPQASVKAALESALKALA